MSCAARTSTLTWAITFFCDRRGQFWAAVEGTDTDCDGPHGNYATREDLARELAATLRRHGFTARAHRGVVIAPGFDVEVAISFTTEMR